MRIEEAENDRVVYESESYAEDDRDPIVAAMGLACFVAMALLLYVSVPDVESDEKL